MEKREGHVLDLSILESSAHRGSTSSRYICMHVHAYAYVYPFSLELGAPRVDLEELSSDHVGALEGGGGGGGGLLAIEYQGCMREGCMREGCI